MPRGPYVIYILASHSRRTYVGVTSNLAKRLHQHRAAPVDAFTKQYATVKLVYYEVADGPYAAIAREKQLKGWRREKKVALIESANRDWRDLAPDLGLAEPLDGPK